MLKVQHEDTSRNYSATVSGIVIELILLQFMSVRFDIPVPGNFIILYCQQPCTLTKFYSVADQDLVTFTRIMQMNCAVIVIALMLDIWFSGY
jgi:hypothetical protein